MTHHFASRSIAASGKWSTPVSHPPNDVKLNTTVRRLFLVATDDSVETDFLAALKTSEVVQKFAGIFELVFSLFSTMPNFWIFFICPTR